MDGFHFSLSPSGIVVVSSSYGDSLSESIVVGTGITVGGKGVLLSMLIVSRGSMSMNLGYSMIN